MLPERKDITLYLDLAPFLALCHHWQEQPRCFLFPSFLKSKFAHNHPRHRSTLASHSRPRCKNFHEIIQAKSENNSKFETVLLLFSGCYWNLFLTSEYSNSNLPSPEEGQDLIFTEREKVTEQILWPCILPHPWPRARGCLRYKKNLRPRTCSPGFLNQVDDNVSGESSRKTGVTKICDSNCLQKCPRFLVCRSLCPSLGLSWFCRFLSVQHSKESFLGSLFFHPSPPLNK